MTIMPVDLNFFFDEKFSRRKVCFKCHPGKRIEVRARDNKKAQVARMKIYIRTAQEPRTTVRKPCCRKNKFNFEVDETDMEKLFNCLVIGLRVYEKNKRISLKLRRKARC